MKLKPEQQVALEEWYRRYSNDEKFDLREVFDVLESFRSPPDWDVDGIWVDELDPDDFDPDDIADDLTERRLERLQEGANPTKKELKLWMEQKYEEKITSDDVGVYHFYLYEICLSGKTLWFVSLHGCGGVMDDFDGPFDSKDEALEGAGRYEEA